MNTFVLRKRENLQRLGALLREHWEEQAHVGRPLEVVVREHEPRRSTEQNSMLWALLTDVSRQVNWHGMTLTPDDWKDLFTASLRQQRLVPAIDGNGFVALGARTSRMSKPELSQLLELILAFGTERGVAWTHDEVLA